MLCPDVRSVVLVVPGSLDTRTGGYIYDRHIAAGLRARGWAVDVCELDASFPRPSDPARAHAERMFSAIPSGTIALVDSLALGAMPEIVVSHASRLRIAALVHLPLAADVELDPDTADRVQLAEGRALSAATVVIVTGRAALPLLERYRLPPERVVVIEPGTARAPLARGSDGSTLQLVSVATLNPGKGHEDLLAALADVPSRRWHLTCAGSLTRHPQTVERVLAMICRLNLDDHVSLVGDLDAPALERCYDGSDLFVLATLRETYGMAVAEALARGLPVVSTTTGAMPELVGDWAGMLVAPGDRRALADALSRVIGDADMRTRLAEGARRVREQLPEWDRAVDSVATTLESIDHE